MHTHVAWLSFSRLISIMFCELPLTYFHRLPERKLLSGGVHWNGNVFILMKFSSLAALKVVKLTTSSAASDENFIKMTTFSFQCICVTQPGWVEVMCHEILTLLMPRLGDSGWTKSIPCDCWCPRSLRRRVIIGNLHWPCQIYRSVISLTKVSAACMLLV